MQQSETVQRKESEYGSIFLILLGGTIVSLFGSAIPNEIIAGAFKQCFGAFFVGLILYIIFKNAKIEIKS
jgi:uncharacterized membrane protein